MKELEAALLEAAEAFGRSPAEIAAEAIADWLRAHEDAMDAAVAKARRKEPGLLKKDAPDG